MTSLKIDFVSDISCLWCAVGLSSLERALENLQGTVQADLHFQPFELNPGMAPEGEDVGEHLTKKYGSTAQQQEQIRETIRARGAEVGFTFRKEGRSRVYNTFNAHRLLHWALEQGSDHQYRLKKALLKAYFTDGQSPYDIEVLVAAVESAGLDGQRARAILAGDEFAEEVRVRAQFYLNAGIRSVPAIIINDRHLISGGQAVEVFENALREIAANASAQTV